jgi:hypothetical protein
VCGDASHLYKTLELPNRAATSTRRLQMLMKTVRRLLEDENFVTLLRAEAMLSLPGCLLSDDLEDS